MTHGLHRTELKNKIVTWSKNTLRDKYQSYISSTTLMEGKEVLLPEGKKIRVQILLILHLFSCYVN